MADKPKQGEMTLYKGGKDTYGRWSKRDTALDRIKKTLLSSDHVERGNPSAEEPMTEGEYQIIVDFRDTGLRELVTVHNQIPEVFSTAMKDIKLCTAGAAQKSKEVFDEMLKNITSGATEEPATNKEIYENGSALSGWLASETEKALDGNRMDQLLEQIPPEHERYVEIVDHGDLETKKNKERDVSLEQAIYEFIALEGEQWKPKAGFEFRRERTLERIPRLLKKIRKNPEFLKRISEMRKNDTKYLALVEKIKTLAKVYEILEETDVGAVSTEVAELIARMKAAFLAIEFDYSGTEIKPMDEQAVKVVISLYDEYQRKIAEEKENKKGHEVRLLGEIQKMETKQGTMSEYLKLRLSRYQRFWSGENFAKVFEALRLYMLSAEDARADMDARRKAGTLDNLTEQMIVKEYETRKQNLLKALEAPFTEVSGEDEDAPEAENFFMAEYDTVEKSFGKQFFGYDESAPLINRCRSAVGKKELDPRKDKMNAAKALNAFVGENPDALAVIKSIFEGDTAHLDWRLSMDSGDVSLANFMGSMAQYKGYSGNIMSIANKHSTLWTEDMQQLYDSGCFSNADAYLPTSGSRGRKFSWRLTSIGKEEVRESTPKGSLNYRKFDREYTVAQMIQDRIVQYIKLGGVQSTDEILMMKHTQEFKEDEATDPVERIIKRHEILHPGTQFTRPKKGHYEDYVIYLYLGTSKYQEAGKPDIKIGIRDKKVRVYLPNSNDEPKIIVEKPKITISG